MSLHEVPAAARLAESLRRQGRSVDLVLTEKKIGDKLKYAAKVAKYASVIGSSEVESGSYQLKDLESGTIETCKF